MLFIISLAIFACILCVYRPWMTLYLFGLKCFFRRHRHFLVISAPRSGSTLLKDLMNNHPRVKCLGELLNNEHLPPSLSDATPSELLRYVNIQLLRKYYGKKISGFKVFPEQLEDTCINLEELLRTLNDPPVIVLYRKSIIETYVSLMIALKNQKWYSVSEVNNDKVDVDWKQFEYFAKEEQFRWKLHMAALQNYPEKMVVSYEELSENREGVMQEIIKFIGLRQLHRPFTSYSVRQNPLPLFEKITNHEEILPLIADYPDVCNLNIE